MVAAAEIACEVLLHSTVMAAPRDGVEVAPRDAGLRGAQSQLHLPGVVAKRSLRDEGPWTHVPPSHVAEVAHA